MMKNAGAPLTHAKLLRSIWGPEYGNELENNPGKREYILTGPWVAYRFRNPSDPDSPSIPNDDE